jgi:hypothetical protein
VYGLSLIRPESWMWTTCHDVGRLATRMPGESPNMAERALQPLEVLFGPDVTAHAILLPGRWVRGRMRKIMLFGIQVTSSCTPVGHS